MPDTRAAMKRSPRSDDDRVYLHAVLLDDPVKRLHRHSLRQLRGRRELRFFNYSDAPEAMCSRRVRVVYPSTFQPDDDDDVCQDCKQLMAILQLDPEQYPEQARRTAKRVQEHEDELREKHEKRAKAQKAQDKILAAPDIFAAVAEIDEEDAADLFDLLRRDGRDNPDVSNTA
jgi:hypothetical protein